MPDWQESLDGSDCYFCPPREANNEYRREIARLPVSTLYLCGDQRFRGYCLLIFDGHHATVFEDLNDEEYLAYLNDLRTSAKALRAAFKPDHMNFELLGNSTPHLHWHIVPRYKNDPRWGQPVWEGWPRDEFNLNRHALGEDEYSEMVSKIQTCLQSLTQ
jgi:diadenosine tetraphosphate (Ap4A) HIT family hydrolase